MKNNSKKILLGNAIVFFLISVVVFFFIYKEIKKNTDEIRKVEADLATEISKRDEIKTLNSYILSIQNEKAELETHFVQSSDVVPFLNTLERLGQGVGTKVEVNTISIAKDGTGLLVSLKDTGNFEQIYKFITLLENAPYELEFVSVDIGNSVQPDGATSKNTRAWEAEINLKLISFI